MIANRHYPVYYSDTFGMPQEIFLTVADMTQTALVILDFRNPDLSEYYGTAQVFLHWGKRVNPDDEEAMRDPQNKMAIELPFMPANCEFLYFCDVEGRVLTYDTVAELTPVQEITWLYAVVSDRTE